MCKESNVELLKSLQVDDNGHHLHNIAFEDWANKRMSKPRRASEVDFKKVRTLGALLLALLVLLSVQVLLIPRFGAAQGFKNDGAPKIRAVDNFSWSPANGRRGRKRANIKEESINGCFTFNSAIKHDHLDDLLESMKIQHEASSVVRLYTSMFLEFVSIACMEAPGLRKADIDAAFRRVPLMDSHKWAANVVYMFENEPWVAGHQGMLFGASASVQAWHRVGELMACLARELLGLPCFRYVDDYFAAVR